MLWRTSDSGVMDLRRARCYRPSVFKKGTKYPIMRPFDDGETRFCTARAMAIAAEDASGGNLPARFHSPKRPERRRPRPFAGYLVVMVLVLVILACGPRQSGQRTERTEPSAPTASTVWRTQAPPEQPVGAEFGDRLQLVSAKLREPRIVPGE